LYAVGAKFAVDVQSSSLLKSRRTIVVGFVPVTSPVQFTKWYPVSGTAVSSRK